MYADIHIYIYIERERERERALPINGSHVRLEHTVPQGSHHEDNPKGGLLEKRPHNVDDRLPA